MTGLEDYTDSEIRAESAMRGRKAAELARKQLDEQYGLCPDCGGSLRSMESSVAQEHWVANGWKGWPLPPPEDWVGRERVAVEYEVKLTCESGHERYEKIVEVPK